MLERRKVDDIREFSIDNKKASSIPTTAKKKESTLSYEERKKINRNISRIEKKIDQFESEKNEIHSKLLDPEFYKSPEGATSVKKLSSLDNDLEKLTEEWDEWVSKLDD